jgi:hypothetical protein
MFKLETPPEGQIKEYQIQFLPNIHTPSESFLEWAIPIQRQKVKKYFSYILKDNKAEIFSFGQVIKKQIQKMYTERYMYDGIFVTDDFDDIKKANNIYLNKITGEIHFFIDFGESKKDYQKINKKDIHLESPINPYHITSGVVLNFKTSNVQGYLKVDNFKWTKTTHLWSEGQDKQKILDLYEGLESLEDCKNRLVQEYAEKL